MFLSFGCWKTSSNTSPREIVLPLFLLVFFAQDKLPSLVNYISLIPIGGIVSDGGGVTHSYGSTNNLAAICLRGRWGSLKTARIYICDGIAQLSELTFSRRTKKRLETLATKCRPDYLLSS